MGGKNVYYHPRKWYPKLCSLIKKSSKRHGFNFLSLSVESETLKCIWIIKPSICSWPFDLSILWGNDCPDPPRWNYYSWAWFLSVTTMSRAPPPYVLVLLLLFSRTHLKDLLLLLCCDCSFLCTTKNPAKKLICRNEARFDAYPRKNFFWHQMQRFSTVAQTQWLL